MEEKSVTVGGLNVFWDSCHANKHSHTNTLSCIDVIFHKLTVYCAYGYNFMLE